MSAQLIELGDVVDIVMGQAPPGTACNKDGAGTVFVKAGEFQERSPAIREWTTRPLKMALPNDSLVCVVGATSGKVNYSEFECAIGRSVAAVRPKASHIAPAFLFQFLQTKVEQLRDRSQGAAQGVITREMLQNLRLILPSLPKQRRIAAILDKADALRTKRREALTQLDRLVQSIFVEMFGDPATNPLGLTILPLIEIAQGGLQNGAYFPKEMYSLEGIEMVHMSDAFGGIVERGNLKRVKCGDDEVAKYTLNENDILIARRSLTYEGAAKPCRVPKSRHPLIFESSFIRIRPDLSKVNTTYLFHYLNNERVRERFVRPYVTQSTISGINQSNLARIPLMLPPYELQEQFAGRLEAVHRARIQNVEAIKLSGELFDSLQHRAFKGEL